MSALSSLVYAVAAERARDRDGREAAAERREQREIERAREAVEDERQTSWGRS